MQYERVKQLTGQALINAIAFVQTAFFPTEVADPDFRLLCHCTSGASNSMTLPKVSVQFQDSAEPLRKRAPSHDEEGRPLADFMMLIPGLREKPRQLINKTVQDIHLALTHFNHAVVFAEFNIRLNLLWVSIKPIHGIRLEIAGAIQEYVPEAKLVSHI